MYTHICLSILLCVYIYIYMHRQICMCVFSLPLSLSVDLSIRLSVYHLSVCLSVYLSLCLSIYLSIYLASCLSELPTLDLHIDIRVCTKVRYLDVPMTTIHLHTDTSMYLHIYRSNGSTYPGISMSAYTCIPMYL